MKSAFLIFPSVLLMMFGFGCAHQSAPATKPNPAPAATNTSTPAVPQPATNTSTPAPAPAKKPRADFDFAEAAARPTSTLPGTGWKPLFNGKSLNGWKETDFAGRGEVSIEHNLLVLHTGDPFTGVNYTNNFPRSNYEVALEAMRVTGADFFCGLTVPVKDTFCSLIVGGWGGSLMGISSIDGMDASENDTTRFINFEQGGWYHIRLRVTDTKIQVWLDDKKVIETETTDHRISLRPGDIEMSKPMGISAWQTTSALREIKVRAIDGPAPGKQ